MFKGLKNLFLNLRIRNKFMLGYLTIFVFTILLTSIIIFFIAQKTISKNIESELKNSTRLILNMVKTSAHVSIRNYLRAVAEKNIDIIHLYYNQAVNGIISESEAKLRARENLLSQKIGTTGYIYTAHSTGISNIHPIKEVEGTDFSHLPFVNELVTRKIGYLEYEWKNPGEKEKKPKALYMDYFEPWDWIIAVSTYREEFGQLVKINDFEKSISSLKFGQTGYPFILDSKGNIIIHPFSSGNIYDAQDGNDKDFIHYICLKKNGQINYSWKNPDEKEYRRKIAYFNYIPELDWIVVSSGYLEEFNRPLKSLQIILISISGIALLLSLILSWAISNLINHRLFIIVSKIKKSVEGDFSVSIDELAKDEIGLLGKYFNKLMKYLSYHQKERDLSELKIQEAYFTLERKVIERTEQLAEANKVLQIQNQELKEAARLKEDVALMTSHDLKNPLNGIISLPQFLMFDENLTEDQTLTLQKIMDLGYTMLNMVNLTLDLFKMERGIYQFKPEKINLFEIMDLISIEKHSQLSAKKVNIIIQLGEGCNKNNHIFNVQGEKLLCYTLFANLIANAIEASPKKQTITITFSKNQQAIITIHNLGAVPENIRDRFFEKFATSGKEKGTGLGTYSAKLIVETQQGSISMKSSEEKGTIITIKMNKYE
ncbi:MAG: cache domain-containing protein [Spirochaetes bacterium]|nr:cache domain-containing protein [Spirochaetota bacterium]